MEAPATQYQTRAAADATAAAHRAYLANGNARFLEDYPHHLADVEACLALDTMPDPDRYHNVQALVKCWRGATALRPLVHGLSRKTPLSLDRAISILAMHCIELLVEGQPPAKIARLQRGVVALAKRMHTLADNVRVWPARRMPRDG